MGLRIIAQEGDPILRKISKPVIKFDSRLHKLLDDMYETMLDAPGVGLAAPQVSVLRRVVVIDIGEGKIELINPKIVKTKGQQECPEGCLSVPDRHAIVLRPEKVTVRAQDRHGSWFDLTGEGYLAQAISHELDHLDGVLFIDKMLEELPLDDEQDQEDED